MTDNIKDKLDGKFDQAKGDVREAAGDATHNSDLKQEGQQDQGKGKLKEGLGEAKGKVSDAVDKVKNS
jgi:uncharacterized protein YjbJ (UPF0337 family)